MARQATAIELAPGRVRLLTATPGGGGLAVSRYVAEPLPPEGATPELLADLFRRHGVVGERVASALPAGRVAARDLEFPFKEAGKIRDALPFAMEPLLPYPVEEAVLDHYPLPGADPWPVRAFAAEQSVVEAHLHLLEQAGVVPTVVADPVTALINGLEDHGALEGEGVVAVAQVAPGQFPFAGGAAGGERHRRVLRRPLAGPEGGGEGGEA
ncbi:MAG: hypothetical protein D6739_11940, partial [Nitrospirae bacterium]